MRADLSSIAGLRWIDRWRIDNGADSFVIPFPTTRPATVVYHGDRPFSYGHYGIHLGQMDRLTFLGPSNRTIVASFIDCREESPTRHRRLVTEFLPSSAHTLCIPAGVAHAFDHLDSVFTINDYELFLPKPEDWLHGSTDWNIDNDVVNLPIDIGDSDLPTFRENQLDASDLYYNLLAANQRISLESPAYEYPFTEDVTLASGQSVRLQLRKPAAPTDEPPEESIPDIDGLAWIRHRRIPSGPHSGFVPLLDPFPFYVVDHGETDYSHDAYGIHLGQEDRLTFVGPSDRSFRIDFVDCRESSPTKHARVSLDVTPSALRYLKIPPGVAHRLLHVENIYTINRPAVFLGVNHQYESATDVIDWPAHDHNWPTVQPNSIPASTEFYVHQAVNQQLTMQEPPKHATPVVLLCRDSEGRSVRVAFRKSTAASASAKSA